MIEFYYNFKKYTSYYQLLIDILEAEEAEDILTEYQFPLDYEIYICSLLNQKFPDSKLNVEEVKGLLQEELALKTITLRDQGLKSASSSNF